MKGKKKGPAREKSLAGKFGAPEKKREGPDRKVLVSAREKGVASDRAGVWKNWSLEKTEFCYQEGVH